MKRIFTFTTVVATLFILVSCSRKSNEVWFKLSNPEPVYDWEKEEWIESSWDWYIENFEWEKKGEWYVCNYPKDSTSFKLDVCFHNDIDVLRAITHLELPSSINSIGNYSFCCANNLTNIVIPLNVTSIGDRAFGWMDSLTSILVPKDVKLGEDVFIGSDNLRINYYSEKKTLKSFFTIRKTYNVTFDKLSFELFSEEFALPKTMWNCNFEITTSNRKFNICDYFSKALELQEELDSDGALLHTPPCNALVSVFDENGEKRIEFTCKNRSTDGDYWGWSSGGINKIKIWEEGHLRCEAKGHIDWTLAGEFKFIGGEFKFYDYDDDWIRYLKLENITKGYSDGCKKYDRYITEYYPSGRKYHIVKIHAQDDSGALYESDDGYVYECVEDVYLTEDGAEMSIVDRLFLNVKDFLIFKTDKRGVRYNYIAVLPRSSSNRSGHIVGFSSSRGIQNGISVVAYCDYLIYENSIECSNFRESNWIGEWRNSPYASKIYMDIEDADDGIMLKSSNNTTQWFDNANFTTYNTDYLDLQTRQFLKEAFYAYVAGDWNWIRKHEHGF